MTDIFTRARSRRHYLLIPSPPTPNGRLHLGHIAGPFLKLDVMARAFRMDGDIAGIMSASDVYESYVTLRAWRDGLEPEQVCEKYHALIARDMDALMIEYDGYCDPLAVTERQMVAE